MKLFSIKNLLVACGSLFAAFFSSCEDMLDVDSDLYVYADDEHLNDATDTLYSVTGIMHKLQMLADRTILLGELRGDLVEVTEYADSDLRDIASFSVGDDNRYNNPRDYYAVINNCNYFIAHADTALKNNRGDRIFEKEFAAVKAYRAWTYLQLALVYGRVPFVTEPLVEMGVDEASFPVYDLNQICDYFIADLAPHAGIDMPDYGLFGTVDSRLVYFPIHILLGEFNLWRGNYREAALCYYRYISTRNGEGTSWPFFPYDVYWAQNDNRFERAYDAWTTDCFLADKYSITGELVTMIPTDSIPSSNGYSDLSELWNSTVSNNGFYSLVPSSVLKSLSGAQVYCNQNTNKEVSYVPSNLPDNLGGDLRLAASWQTSTRQISGLPSGVDRPVTQVMKKYTSGTTQVNIWRQAMVYLHMAEAVNRAGFPEFAYRILATGVNNHVVDSLQRAYPADSVWLAHFNFPNTEYILRSESSSSYNTIGIHSRGSGYTEVNEFYPMPSGTLEEQIEAVEDLIVNESALEMAFEGQRFYDLMRVSLRRGDPSYLALRVNARGGAGSPSGVSANLSDPQTWYLGWRGKVGY